MSCYIRKHTAFIVHSIVYTVGVFVCAFMKADILEQSSVLMSLYVYKHISMKLTGQLSSGKGNHFVRRSLKRKRKQGEMQGGYKTPGVMPKDAPSL